MELGQPGPLLHFWAPGPIQVEELGCLEAEAEAREERCGAAVPDQPPAPVSGASALGFSGWVLGGQALLLCPSRSSLPESSRGLRGVGEKLPCPWVARRLSEA